MAETAKTATAVEPTTPFPKPRDKILVEPSMDESAPLLIRSNTLGMFPALSGDCDAEGESGDSLEKQASAKRKGRKTRSAKKTDAGETQDDEGQGSSEGTASRPPKISRKHSLMFPVSSMLLHTTSSLDLVTEPADTHVFDQDEEGDGPNDSNSENEAEQEASKTDDNAKTGDVNKDDVNDCDEEEYEDGDDAVGPEGVRHAKTMSGGVTTIEDSATGIGEEDEEDLEVKEEAPDAVGSDDDEEEEVEEEEEEENNLNEKGAAASASATSPSSGAAAVAASSGQSRMEPMVPAPARPGPITRRQSFKDASHSSWRVF
ncbi:Hypothetical Protein FCC1311_018982 [Hondaea fermentalgiana]|uniref:Uncharacterized protein n=1 Tax=Hondaea fermentalgiana TaxID=2315210 RepID=A0A2R5G5Q9_9STRA|nr:Hypothetical Protein FCC1311_018982 [Hondaea fermentalgiana]|eukprot:GBG25679.1 Hypothetical Protein FCC1311_018982 [Hondaea fermentalgiana]